MKKIIKRIVSIILVLMISNTIYSCDIGSRESNQIVVYSLYDNNLMRTCIYDYMTKNPKIKIKYEVGISSKSITKQDAIKTLNAEIMSGSGPDIIDLDELPIDKYVKKGMLENVNDIFTKMQSDNQLLPNIVDYYTKSGKTYMMPTRIKMPLTVGQNIGNTKDISTLAESIKNNITYAGDLIRLYTPNQIVYTLYKYDGAQWIDNKGNVNKEKITLFLEGCKSIYDSEQQNFRIRFPKYKENIINEDINSEEFEKDYKEKSSNITGVIGTSGQVPMMDVGCFDSFNNSIYLMQVQKYLPLYNINLWQNDGKNIFVPKNQVAISTKGQNKKLAKEFIKYLFTKDSQKTELENWGLPVNRQAIIQLIYKYSGGGLSSEYPGDNGKVIKMTWTKPTDEEKDSFISRMESLNQSAYINFSNSEEAINEAVRYVSGNETLDEAVNKICSKFELQSKEK